MPSLLSLLLLLPLLQPALSEVTVGLFVPAIAKNDQIDDVQTFLEGAISLVKEEPDTIQWFGVKFTDVDDPTFAIFDTFVSEEGRQTHLDGKVAGALFDNADKLFEDTPEVNKANILARKVQESGDGSLTEGLSVGLRVNFTAKSDKVQDVRDFLVSAVPLVEDEQDTLFWYAVEFPDSNVFAIIDFFEKEEGREAHLNGKVAAALFSKVDELLTGQPDIVKFDVVSANIKRENGDNEDNQDENKDNEDENNEGQKSMEEMQKMIEEEGEKMAERIKEQENNQNQNEENKEDEEDNEDENKNENQSENNNEPPQGGKEQLCQELCKGLVTMLREKECKTD